MATNYKKQAKRLAKSQLQAVPEAYRRVTIGGVLTLTSELHIGASTPKNTGINEVERDAKGRPYLPGSTLRGALAGLLGESDAVDGLRRRLFGLARQPRLEGAPEASDDGGAGLLTVFDACVVDEGGQPLTGDINTIERSRTRIDAVTGTALEHHLLTLELVPVGTCFKFELSLDHTGTPNKGITDKEIQTVLGLLNGLNEQSIGTGKSIGQGHLAWEQRKLEGVSEAEYCRWLLNGLTQKVRTSDALDITRLATYNQPLTLVAGGAFKSAAPWLSQGFSLSLQSPLLINDAVAVKAEKDQAETANMGEGKAITPNHIFLKRKQAGELTAVVPGATLKGWFRAQARRILLTLTQGARHEQVDELLKQLFGGTEHGSSLIYFGDVTVSITDDDVHAQMFNAVDRFTGGVKDSALFSARALWTAQAMTGQLRYKDSDRLAGWMRLLLLYVWSDAKEGDLVLGWGKGKGFGRLLLTAADEDERSWLEKPDASQCELWQAELHEALGLTAEEINNE